MADLEPDKITNAEKDINNNILIKENFSVEWLHKDKRL